MRILKGIDIFDCLSWANVICITTNGIVKRNGEAAMRAGITKQLRDSYPKSAAELGKAIMTHGNVVQWFYTIDGVPIVSFPTKRHWKDKSDIDLIKSSCIQLAGLTVGMNNVLIPAPGVGCGGLSWETEVKPVIEPLLKDSRFVICFLDKTC